MRKNNVLSFKERYAIANYLASVADRYKANTTLGPVQLCDELRESLGLRNVTNASIYKVARSADMTWVAEVTRRRKGKGRPQTSFSKDRRFLAKVLLCVVEELDRIRSELNGFPPMLDPEREAKLRELAERVPLLQESSQPKHPQSSPV